VLCEQVGFCCFIDAIDGQRLRNCSSHGLSVYAAFPQRSNGIDLRGFRESLNASLCFCDGLMTRGLHTTWRYAIKLVPKMDKHKEQARAGQNRLILIATAEEYRDCGDCSANLNSIAADSQVLTYGYKSTASCTRRNRRTQRAARSPAVLPLLCQAVHVVGLSRGKLTSLNRFRGDGRPTLPIRRRRRATWRRGDPSSPFGYRLPDSCCARTHHHERSILLPQCSMPHCPTLALSSNEPRF